MKKLLLFCGVMLTMAAQAQVTNDATDTESIYMPEDSVRLTVDGLINEQQEISVRNSNINHFADVWERKSYVNLSFNSTTMSPKSPIPTGVSYNGGVAPEFKSDWGASIQLGRSYKLHKKPISNILQFYIDYTYFDLNVNHFKAESDGKNLYNSSNTYRINPADKDSVFYMPWNLQKYELNYGMAIGPSVTIAPFTKLSNQNLHYLKFNLYYHIGYHVSLLYIPNNEDADVNQETNSSKSAYKQRETMKNNLKLSLGHGFTHTFGFNVSWKLIGLGYEHRSATQKSKILGKSDFGSVDNEFSVSSNRFYVQFRM